MRVEKQSIKMVTKRESMLEHNNLPFTFMVNAHNYANG